MSIEIVHQTESGLVKKTLELEAGLNVRLALGRAGINLTDSEAVSVWNEKATLETPLNAGDRIEICGPILVDPKEARRIRAENKSAPANKQRRHAVR